MLFILVSLLNVLRRSIIPFGKKGPKMSLRFRKSVIMLAQMRGNYEDETEENCDTVIKVVKLN
jgi:hypothetical protein